MYIIFLFLLSGLKPGTQQASPISNASSCFSIGAAPALFSLPGLGPGFSL
jgi:hypothetical protein